MPAIAHPQPPGLGIAPAEGPQVWLGLHTLPVAHSLFLLQFARTHRKKYLWLMRIQRDRGLTVRMTSNELVKLGDLAEHEAISQSDIVRRLILREHAAVFGKETKGPGKKGARR